MAEPKVFVQYLHHGRVVSVRQDLKGTHRDVCLCYDCSKFNPGVPEENCPIANMLYGVSLLAGTVTPIFECPEFEQGPRYQFKTETGQA